LSRVAIPSTTPPASRAWPRGKELLANGVTHQWIGISKHLREVAPTRS